MREELDYEEEKSFLYSKIFENHNEVKVPKVFDSLSTKKLLSMEWLKGKVNGIQR